MKINNFPIPVSNVSVIVIGWRSIVSFNLITFESIGETDSPESCEKADADKFVLPTPRLMKLTRVVPRTSTSDIRALCSARNGKKSVKWTCQTKTEVFFSSFQNLLTSVVPSS